MTAEFKRYYANKGDIWEDNEVGEYVRLSDAIAALEAVKAQVRDEVLESAAVIADKEGVYPELNVWNDGPDWYQHGKRIAAAIRAMKGGA